jgi:hypothetical protein
MKIFRDGKEYELTFSEMIQAHEEYELDCMVEDVRSKYEEGEYDVELSEDDISEVASFALHNLSKNDSYFEAYWMSVEYTLDNYIDNLPVDEEEEE